MQYETCRHVKEDGSYCGSPALREQKYCYYHLMERGRRLRRARALRDNAPYRLEIESLDNLYAVRAALTEIVQALAAGQLDPRTAGQMLYAIQQVASANRRIAQMEAAQLEAGKDASAQDLAADSSRVQECANFPQKFGIRPGADIDAETDAVLRKADAEAELRHANDFPAPPPGLRLGSPQYHVYREQAYQLLNMQLNDMRRELRDYHEMKRQQMEKLTKEMLSATPSTERLANSAWSSQPKAG